MTRRKAADRQIIMSIPQVAARWGLSPVEVFDLCVRGELPHHRIGDLVRIRFRDIEAYEERQRELRAEPPET
jgi:excisionase family DNA binding protein